MIIVQGITRQSWSQSLQHIYNDTSTYVHEFVHADTKLHIYMVYYNLLCLMQAGAITPRWKE